MQEFNLNGIDPQIIGHLRKVWQFNTLSGRHSPTSMLDGIVADFRVIEIPPLTDRGIWAYVSVGANQVLCEPRKEFILLNSVDDDQNLQTLAETVFRHAVPGNSLTVGDSFCLGRPWTEGSSCDCLLISRPYLYPPDLEFLEYDGLHLQLLWLLPITTPERDFLIEHGLDVLEQLFEERRIQPLDPFRPSVIHS